MTNVSSVQDSKDMYGLILMGIAFIVYLVGFVVGFAVIEFTTKRIVKRVIDLIEDANLTDNEIEYQKTMYLVIQWAMRDRSLTEYVRCLINSFAASKIELRFTDLIVTAIYMHYFIDGFHSSSLMLLKQAEELGNSENMFQRLDLYIQKKHLMEAQNVESAERGEYLFKVYKSQENIMILQKTFWKNVMSDDFSIITVEQLTRKIQLETEYCRTILENLISQKRDKTVYRAYARFMEQFLFEKEIAEEYYEVGSNNLKIDFNIYFVSRELMKLRNQKQRKELFHKLPFEIESIQ